MKITDLFPDARRIATRDIKVGDRIAYQPEGQSAACIADVSRINSAGELITAEESRIGEVEEQKYYLVNRAKCALPRIVGSMVRVLPTTNLDEACEPLEGIPLVLTKLGDWRGIGPDGQLRGVVHSELQGYVWERIWITQEDPDEIVDAEVLDDDAQKLKLPDEPGSIVRIDSHGNLPSHCVRTDMPQFMIKEPSTGLFAGIGPNNMLRLAASDFDLYRVKWKRVWITENEPSELASDQSF